MGDDAATAAKCTLNRLGGRDIAQRAETPADRASGVLTRIEHLVWPPDPQSFDVGSVRRLALADSLAPDRPGRVSRCFDRGRELAQGRAVEFEQGERGTPAR
jgi:hypothetical protein